MSELGDNRPRRAAAPDESLDPDEPIGVDDTAGPPASPARRGSATEPPQWEPEPSPGESSVNPFARPGSDSAAQPVLPPADFEDPVDTSSGRRQGATADGPSPAPRRSAVSSSTPPDDMVPPPAAAQHPSWVDHHRRTLLIWVVGAVVAAVLLAAIAYGIRRSTTPEPTPTPTTSGPVATSSAPPVPDASDADLIDVTQAESIVPAAGWVVTDTLTDGVDYKSRACLTTDPDTVNPTVSLQRTLGTTGTDKLALLHQIDAYADEATAEKVQAQRLLELAACDQVPAHIVGATQVSGLADDVQQVTVVYQEAVSQFHTVFLVRTGRVLSVLDIARNGAAVGVPEAIAGLTQALAKVCDRAEGTCPTQPAAVPAPPPAADPPGWLIAADLPRLRPGAGQWTATAPADITTAGTGCENLTLATVAGPATRNQRTYLLTQGQAPETFGMDELLFTFATPDEAGRFVALLGSNLVNCKKRMLTATVKESTGSSGTLPDGTRYSSRIITITQATSATSSLTYQVVLTVTGTRVSYLLATVTPDFLFASTQLSALAVRLPQRAAQA